NKSGFSTQEFVCRTSWAVVKRILSRGFGLEQWQVPTPLHKEPMFRSSALIGFQAKRERLLGWSQSSTAPKEHGDSMYGPERRKTERSFLRAQKRDEGRNSSACLPASRLVTNISRSNRRLAIYGTLSSLLSRTCHGVNVICPRLPSMCKH